VAVLDPAARLGLVLEDDDFVAAHWANDLAGDLRAIDDWRTDEGLIAVGYEQHAPDIDPRARLSGELIELQLRAEFDAILLPAVFDDCVHASPKARDEDRALSFGVVSATRQDDRVRRELEE
jgi:hypothetical protein